MSAVKPYPEYKVSGVEWLGAIPAGWSVAPIKYVADLRTSNVDKKSHEGEKPVLLCNYTDVYYHDSISPDMDFMPATASESQIAAFTLREGDTIITKDSETSDDIGLAAYVPESLDGVVCGYHLAVYRPKDVRYGSFIKRFFDSKYAKSLLDVSAQGVTRVGLGQPALKNLLMPLPPVEEAATIASYLDHETAEIDTFILDQEELIELLKERRTTTIAQAISKGLDPKVQMKDSGVPWVGKMPEHWGAQRLSWLFNTISSGTTPPSEGTNYYGGDINWVTTGELRESVITETSKKVTQEAVSELSALRVYEPGTLLIAMYGATIGRLGILGAPATTNQACCAMADPKGVSVAFMSYVLLAAREHLLVLASGGGQPNINQDKLRSLRVATPPLTEQQEIVDYLDYETAEIDAAIADAKEAIELSKERRAALISAAVTGKIDVRNHITAELGAA